jgi:hypothetical protein
VKGSNAEKLDTSTENGGRTRSQRERLRLKDYIEIKKTQRDESLKWLDYDASPKVESVVGRSQVLSLEQISI